MTSDLKQISICIRQCVTYAQCGALSVITSKMQDAFCCHGQACVLGET